MQLIKTGITKRGVIKFNRVSPSLNLNTTPQKPAFNNVLSEVATVALKVTRIFTDVDGRVIPSIDARVSGLLTRWPFFLFGEFDRAGGYSVCNKVNPNLVGSYLFTFVNGCSFSSENVTGFSGFNEVQNLLNIGDVVSVFTDNRQNPNFYIWIVVSNPSISVGSVFDNTKTAQNDNRRNPLNCYSINYYVQNPTQWNEPLTIVNFDNTGGFKADEINASIYRDPFNALPEFITLKVNFSVNQYAAIIGYLEPGSETLSLVFNFKQ